MHLGLTLLSALVAIVLMGACQDEPGQPEEAPAVTSGIEGLVTIAPTRPGPVRPSDADEGQPFQATLLVLTPEGQPVAQTQSGEDGVFRIPLPPGSYILRPVTNGRLPRAAEQSVTVTDGQFTAVSVRFDSGIR